MSAVHEKFNVDREESIKNYIDPTGKKWNVIGGRGSALCHAEPDPGNEASAIPKEFAGQWTSPSTLKDIIEVWLNKKWDEVDVQNTKRIQREGIRQLAAEAEQAKQTPEESLEALPQEIKDVLGDAIKQEEPEVVISDELALATLLSCTDPVEEKKPVVKKKAKKKVTK